jgi:hypothetical protein
MSRIRILFWLCVLIGFILLILWGAGVFCANDTTISKTSSKSSFHKDGTVSEEFRLINTIEGRNKNFGFPTSTSRNGVWMVTLGCVSPVSSDEILIYRNNSLDGSDFALYKSIALNLPDSSAVFYVRICEDGPEDLKYILVAIHKKSKNQITQTKEFYRVYDISDDSFVTIEAYANYEITKGMIVYQYEEKSYELLLGFVSSEYRQGLIEVYCLNDLGSWEMYQSLRDPENLANNQFGMSMYYTKSSTKSDTKDFGFPVLISTSFLPHRVIFYKKVSQFVWELWYEYTVVLHDSIFAGSDLFLSPDLQTLIVSDPYKNINAKNAVGCVYVYEYDTELQTFSLAETLYPRYKYDDEMFGLNIGVFFNVLVVGCYDKDQYMKHVEVYLRDKISGKFIYTQSIDWPFSTVLNMNEIKGGSISFFQRDSKIFMTNGYNNSDKNAHGMITVYSASFE